MKRMLSLMLCALLIAGLFAGCGSASDSINGMLDGGFDSGGGFDQGASAEPNGDREGLTDQSNPLQPAPKTDRKLVRTVQMEAETQNYDDFMTGLNQKIAELGGYVEDRETHNNSSVGDRYCSITVRIPASELHSFLTLVNISSNVLNTSETTEDVTLQYVDTASRVSALQTEQVRLKELLAQASNVTEILEIEERLSQVSYELESYASQLRTYDNLVDFATLHLHIYEVQILTPVDPPSIWQRISSGSRQTWKDLVAGSGDLFVWIIVNLPYLVLIGLGILAVKAVSRRHSARKKERKQRRQAQAVTPEENHDQEKPEA